MIGVAVGVVAAAVIGLIVEYLRLRRRLLQLEEENHAVDIYFGEKDPNGWAAAKAQAHLQTRRGYDDVR